MYIFCVLYRAGVALANCTIETVVDIYGENGQCVNGNPTMYEVMTLMVDYQWDLFGTYDMHVEKCE